MKNSGKNNTNKKDGTGIAAFITALVVVGAVISSVVAVAYKDKKEEYEYIHMYDNVPEGYVMFHDGFTYKIDETLEDKIYTILDSEYVDNNEKYDLLEALNRQGISTMVFEQYLETSKKIESNSDNYYKAFLESVGLLESDTEISKTESGMTLVNSKPAKSYRTLADAENAFGLNLGLYFYCDSLKNYEMVNAFIVDDEFLHCVYAINQDGTALEENQDIESTDVKTLTVKLSTSIKAEELINVYNNYDTVMIKELDDTQITYCGKDDNINLIYCDRVDDKRSYAIYSVDGLSKETAENLMHELFSNLRHYKNGASK